MFNIISENTAITPKSNPLSNSIIEMPEVEAIGNTIYFNKEDTKLELNFYFSSTQEQWKSDEVKLRSSLSEDLNNLRKTPKSSMWSQHSDIMDSWYKQARDRAKQFEVDFATNTFGHCKLEHQMTNENNIEQNSWRTVPFIFASVGEQKMKHYVFVQLGYPYLKDGKLVVDTWCGVYPITKQAKNKGATEIWQQTYPFGWSDLTKETINE